MTQDALTAKESLTRPEKRSINDLGGSGYDANDCMTVSRDINVNTFGSSLFKKHFVNAENKLSELKQQRKENNKQQSKDLPSHFSLEKKRIK